MFSWTRLYTIDTYHRITEVIMGEVDFHKCLACMQFEKSHRITIIVNVGHGDCTITLCNKKGFLIDAGSQGRRRYLQNFKKNYLS